MLKTPLGEIIILIDNTEIEYTAVAAALDRTCDKQNGRYYIRVDHEIVFLEVTYFLWLSGIFLK